MLLRNAIPKSFLVQDKYSLKFSYKKGSNIDSHIRWMEYLLSDKYNENYIGRFTSSRNQSQSRKIARTVIRQLIYQAWPDPGTRTNRLYDSFRVVAGEGKRKSAVISVYSDPSIAPAKTGQVEGIASYAAFFEDPSFNSFLPPDEEPTSPSKFRPFFDVLTQELREFIVPKALETHMKEIERKMPKQAKNQ